MHSSLRLLAYCGIAVVALWSPKAFADQQIGSVVQRHFNGATGFRLASTNGELPIGCGRAVSSDMETKC